MNTRATRPKTDTVTLVFDLTTEASTRRSMKAYAAEIAAYVEREVAASRKLRGEVIDEIATRARVSAMTVKNHMTAREHGLWVIGPQVRTFTGILFALGYEEVAIRRGSTVTKSPTRRRRKRKVTVKS